MDLKLGGKLTWVLLMSAAMPAFARRHGCLRIRNEHCQSPRIQSPEDCLTTANARKKS
jgi:hypothetical protein